MKDQFGQDYNTHGGQFELNRALANGDYNAQVAIRTQMAYSDSMKYVPPSSSTYSNYYYSNSGVKTKSDFSFIKSIFYLFFIFVPKFIFYYLPFKHFGKTLIVLMLAGFAYIGFSPFGYLKLNELEMTLEPKRIQFTNIDKYGFDAKLIKKYRSLDAKGLARAGKDWDNLPVLKQNIISGVIRERLLQNPQYFNGLQNTSSVNDFSFSMNACNRAKSLGYGMDKQNPQMTLENGFFEFYEGCTPMIPATQYYDTIKSAPNYPPIKAELDRLNSNPIFLYTKNYEIVALCSAILGGLLFLYVVITSMKQDEKVRKENKEAKAKLEAEKLEKGEKPKSVTDFKAEKNIFTE